MSSWRRKAIEAAPELKKELETVANPMQAWIELHSFFENLNFDEDPKAVSRIMDYARWCISEKAGKLPSDTSTAVWCAFYEHLPQKRENWGYFKTWFTRDEFESLKGAFSYFLQDHELEDLSREFYGRQKKARKNS